MCTGCDESDMARNETLVHAAVGALVSLVLTFLPFSPLVGGAVAGYLEGGDSGDGLRVGAIAGVLYSIPGLLIMLLFGSVFAFLPVLGGRGFALGALGFVVVLVALVFVVVYGIALSAVGGLVGNYVQSETDIGG